MEARALDILAFGAHADDVEIGMGGTIAKYSEQGYKIGICDLTKAELSSNGTVELRMEEATYAAKILGVAERINLGFFDRSLKIDNEKIKKIVEIIRRYRPAIIFAPYHIDRHPDHGDCSTLVKEAFFSSGIHKFQTDTSFEAYRPKDLYFYMINGFEKPDFVVDISSFINKKIDSLLAYKSQFIKTENSVDTPLTNGYIDMVKSRESLFGKDHGITYAEGFKVNKPLLLDEDLIGRR